MRALDEQWLDTTMPIGDDFYEYANGNWLASNPVPKEYGAWSGFREAQIKNEALLKELLQNVAKQNVYDNDYLALAGSYFASAMDTDAIATAGARPLMPFADEIDAVNSVKDLPMVIARLHKAGIKALFSIEFDPDFDNPDAYLPYLNQGGLGLPERDYYMRSDHKSLALQTAYQNHITSQLCNFGNPKTTAAQSARAIYAFESAMAEFSYTAARRRDIKLTLNRYTLKDLQKLMPTCDLTEYLVKMGIGLKSVNIENPGFFTGLDELLGRSPIESIKAYLLWNVIRRYASALSPEFENEAFRFYGTRLSGQTKQHPRWKRVLDMAGGDLQDAIGRLFVETAFSEESKQRCEHMVDQLLAAMERSIQKLDWMTDATKQAARTKLKGFGYKIGFPDAWQSYDGLILSKDVSFVENRIAAVSYDIERRIQRLHEPVNKNEWEMPAYAVNAYYHPLVNEIVFPAGILQPPFYYADADDAVNYGGIGTVIGHEITHGFDDQGCHFDANGRFTDWWTEEDRAEFNRRAATLVKQFNSYTILDGKPVNGKLTLGENIADLGGLTIAYDALMHACKEVVCSPVDGLTPQQRFFLSYATVWRTNYKDEYLELIVNTDPHSPAKYRCNGPVSNFLEFAKAFNLPKDAPLARPDSERAKIW